MSEKISAEMLETCECCPICDSVGHVAISEVYDWMFKSCSNEWKYKKCNVCGSLYLSPRLLVEHISIAYQEYYTHSEAGVTNSRKKIYKSKMLNDFLTSSMSTDFLSKLKYSIIPPLKNFLSVKSRHISELKPGVALDFGCGNGEFMSLAKSYGWSVKGFDLDEDAVSLAKSSGLDVVHGGILNLAEEKDGKYDLITLSHVIEHVYEPEKLIQECIRLLKPGGRLWLETPNSRSLGLTLFGRYWRGLEPPRHIVLFNFDSIYKILLGSGFKTIEKRRHSFSSIYMSIKSEQNRSLSSCSHNEVQKVKGFAFIRFLIYASIIEIAQVVFKNRSEFLTIVAVK